MWTRTRDGPIDRRVVTGRREGWTSLGAGAGATAGRPPGARRSRDGSGRRARARPGCARASDGRGRTTSTRTEPKSSIHRPSIDRSSSSRPEPERGGDLEDFTRCAGFFARIPRRARALVVVDLTLHRARRASSDDARTRIREYENTRHRFARRARRRGRRRAGEPSTRGRESTSRPVTRRRARDLAIRRRDKKCISVTLFDFLSSRRARGAEGETRDEGARRRVGR